MVLFPTEVVLVTMTYDAWREELQRRIDLLGNRRVKPTRLTLKRAEKVDEWFKAGPEEFQRKLLLDNPEVAAALAAESMIELLDDAEAQ